MKNNVFAETLRWLGFMISFGGLIFALFCTGFFLAPHIVAIAYWVSNNIPGWSVGPLMVGAGAGIFFIGQWISPYKEGPML